MRLKLILLFCCIICFSFLYSQDKYKTFFNKGNKQYSKGNYKEAETNYKKILDAGYFSEELYYNLGNVYFKQNNIPFSILYFEKAMKLNPLSEVTLHNLKIANKRILDEKIILPKIFYEKWWYHIKNIFGIDGWAWISIITCLIIFSAIYSLFFVRVFIIKKTAFYIAIFMFVATFSSFFMAYNLKQDYIKNRYAIVTTPTLNILNEPTKNSTTLFVIHEGTKVEIKDKKSGWVNISISDGNAGWVKEKYISKI